MEPIKLPCGDMLEWGIRQNKKAPAVIICPGGGYDHRSLRESQPVAQAFGAIGFHSFVLQYSVEPCPLHNRPLTALSQAVSCVRDHAEEWDVDPKRIAVCGFSAGAHLAASLGLFWNDAGRFSPDTDLNRHRPNAMILAYPVVTAGEFAHRDTFVRLAGEDVGEQLRYSLERYVTKDAPPAFIWHTADDRTVPVQNSLLLASALMANGVNTELHIYPHGTHGLSLATPPVEDLERGRAADSHVAGWFEQMHQWLETAW